MRNKEGTGVWLTSWAWLGRAYQRQSIWPSHGLLGGIALAMSLGAVDIAQAEPTIFQHAVKNTPLEFSFRKNQEITEAVEAFRQSGENPYSGNAEALTSGQKLYLRQCQSCHLKDGSGKVGPNLRDETWQYARTNTDIGRFEIIYGGGKKSMQAFGRRLDQDDILKVMAYIETFRTGEVTQASTSKTTGVATTTNSTKPKKKQKSAPPIPFTAEFLSDETNISVGGEHWKAQCRHCHGAKAYPGKAPKLKPRKYKPDFVYRRVTDGFRKMPPWKDAYTDEERMQIVAYILSGSFSP
ncbi:MAG: c-type cytochrome [Rhodobacteraceae bacterium]|nr:c-type cytochrome [Paracoccaceae bacterium]